MDFRGIFPACLADGTIVVSRSLSISASHHNFLCRFLGYQGAFIKFTPTISYGTGNTAPGLSCNLWKVLSNHFYWGYDMLSESGRVHMNIQCRYALLGPHICVHICTTGVHLFVHGYPCVSMLADRGHFWP